MPSSFALPEVEYWRGTMPSHAANSLPFRKAAPLPMAATMAVATAIWGDEEAFGSLDTLVNNAGVYSFGPLGSVTEEEFARQYQTNVLVLCSPGRRP